MGTRGRVAVRPCAIDSGKALLNPIIHRITVILLLKAYSVNGIHEKTPAACGSNTCAATL